MYSPVFHPIANYPCEQSDCVSKLTLNSTISSVNLDPPLLYPSDSIFQRSHCEASLFGDYDDDAF